VDPSDGLREERAVLGRLDRPAASDGLREERAVLGRLDRPATSDGLVVGFDLDMTLVDSRPGIVATLKALYDETGAPVAVEGMLEALLKRNLDLEFGDRFPPAEAQQLADRFRELYVQFGVPGTHLLPGATESIAAVRAAGGRVIVVTAKYEPNARRCLAQVGLDVDAVFGWRFAEAKGETLLDEGAHVYVGDTPNDMRAGVASGATTVAVTTGPHDGDELRAAGAAVVLSSLVELPAWIAALPNPAPARRAGRAPDPATGTSAPEG
jgi:phosphoglycolate phosphatase